MKAIEIIEATKPLCGRDGRCVGRVRRALKDPAKFMRPLRGPLRTNQLLITALRSVSTIAFWLQTRYD